jgi:hypothetical protein
VLTEIFYAPSIEESGGRRVPIYRIASILTGRNRSWSSYSRTRKPKSYEPPFASPANFISISLFDVMNALEQNNLCKSLES